MVPQICQMSDEERSKTHRNVLALLLPLGLVLVVTSGTTETEHAAMEDRIGRRLRQREEPGRQRGQQSVTHMSTMVKAATQAST